MPVFTLDTTTPMPESMKYINYPFAEMKEGHSLYFLDERKKESARVAARQFVRTHQPEWKFRTIRDGEGWRIWRIK